MTRKFILALAGLIVVLALATPTATAAGPDHSSQPKRPNGPYLGQFPGKTSPLRTQAAEWIRALDAYVYLQNANSGKCMGVAGANPNNYAPIIQWTCAIQPGSDQRMHIYETEPGSGWYRIDPYFSSNKCVSVVEPATQPGSLAYQYTCANFNAQHFAIRRIRVLNNPTLDWVVEFWVDASWNGNAQLLGVAGGSPNNGAQVMQWTFGGSATDCSGDQCWIMIFGH